MNVTKTTTKKKKKNKTRVIGKTIPFMSLIRKVSRRLKHDPVGLIGDLGKQAVRAAAVARKIIREDGKKVRVPRVIPIAKTGGILPLLPLIFGGLSAAGALAGGGAAVAKAVNEAKAKAKMLEESQRHNQMMEAIALGKGGKGLYLKKSKAGYGLYLKKRMPKNS